MKKSSTLKSSLRNLVMASIAAGPVALVPTLRALPQTGSNLSAPSNVTTTVAGSTLNINIAGSGKTFTILNWGDFGAGSSTIGASDTVQYYQPTVDSAVLNRITGSNQTQIDGKLGSNGLIYILNPNGIVISNGATINAAGFVASAINDTDWSNFSTSGTLSMTGGNAGDVSVGTATITTVSGSGNVVLAGGTMKVSGTVNGNLQVKTVWTGGTVDLSAGGNNLTVNGNLTVNSNGKAIDLANGATAVTTVTGNTTIDSTGTLAYGDVVTTTGGSLVANVSGKTVSINAGGSAYNTNGSVTVNGDVSNLSLTNVDVANVTTTNAATATTVTATTKGNETVTSAGALTIGTSTVGGVLNATANSGDLTLGAITASGNVVATSTAGNIKSSGTVAVANGNSVTLDAAAGKAVTYVGSGNITIAGVSGGSLSITNAGNITANNVVAGPTMPTTISATATGGTITLGNVDVTTAGTLTLSGDNGVTTGTINAKNATVTASAGSASLGAVSLDGVAGALTISAKNTIALPAITAAPTVTVTSTGGDITDANSVLNGAGTVVGSFNAAGAITLSNAANAFSSVKLVNGAAASAVTLSNAKAVTLANGTSTMGATSVTTAAGDITLGAAAADTLSFGALTLNAAGNINATTAKSITASSTVLQAGGAATLDAAGNTFNLGAVSTQNTGVTGALTLTESSGVNLGSITAGSLTISSGTSIWTSGVLTTIGAGAASFDLSAAGDVTLNTLNNLTGAVTIGASGKVANATIKNNAALNIAAITATNSATLTTNATGQNITQTGVITAPTLNVNTAGTSTTTLNSANVLSTVNLGTASTGAVGITNSGGALNVTGTTAGALTVNETGGDLSYNATSVNQAVTLQNNAAGAIWINGSITGAGAQNLSAKTANGAIYLGSFYSQSGGLSADTTATAGKMITDVANSRANIFGDINLETQGGAVSLTNNAPQGLSTSTTVASRFGGYTINTTNGDTAGANITTFEGGTVRIVNVNAGTGGNVSISATNADSEFGSNPSNIVSTVAGTTLTGANISLNARNSVILDAAGNDLSTAGYVYAVANTNSSLATSVVTLGDSSKAATITAGGVVDAIASGDVTINSPQALKLGGGNSVTGDFYAGGNLTVNTGNNTNVTQTADRLRVKGSVSITAGTLGNYGNIDLTTGTDNEFGGMTLTGATVSTTENGTTRLAAVNATTLNVTTTGGDIIDTKGSNVVVSGTTTLTPSGMVNLTNSTGNQIGAVKVVATGAGQNVSINSTSAMTVQNGTNIGGNLTLKDTAASGNAIADMAAGAGFTVGGTATYQATDAAGGINITNPNDSFAKIRVTAGGGGATVYQNNSMVLEPGSTTTNGGNVTLRSINGTISNDATATGSNSFAGTVSLQAMQNVTISNEWFVAGTLSVTTSSGMVVDLSGLSLSVDLHGVNPTITGGTLKSGTPNP